MRTLIHEVYQDFCKQIQAVSGQLYLPKENMRSLRFIYGSLFRYLTGDEPVFFSSDYERMIFVSHRLQLSIEQTKSLRTLGYRLTHFQDEDFDWSENIYVESVKQFQDWLDLLLTVPNEKAKGDSRVFIKEFSESNITQDSISILDAIVTKKGKAIPADDGTGKYFIVQCHSPKFGDFEVLFWKEFQYLQKCIWEGVRLNLLNFKKEEKYFQRKSSEAVLLSPEINAQVVVDPDYLLTATQIAQSFVRGGPHPLVFVLKKFDRPKANRYFFRGSIMNDYFDRLMAGSKVSVEELIKEYFSRNPIYALVFQEEEIQTVKKEIPPHIATLNRKEIQQYRKHRLHFEPTFISETYGLRGRLDMMVEYVDQLERRDVVELKTSKDPLKRGSSFSPDNAAQATCYNLLLQQKNKTLKGGSALLYSSCEAHLNPLRNVPNDRQSYRNVLALRNLIIGMEYYLLHWPEQALSKVKLSALGHLPMWDNDKVLFSDFEDSLKNAHPIEKEWFFAFAKFIARERRASKIGANAQNARQGFSYLWTEKRICEKLANYSMISHLEFDSIVEGKKGREIRFTRKAEEEEITVYRKGDFVLLYPQESEEFVFPTHYQIVKTTIKSIDENALVLLPMNPHIDAVYLEKYKYWAIENEVMENGNDAMFEAIYSFLRCKSDRKRRLILGQEKPEIGQQQSVANFCEELLPVQKEMVAKALAAKDYFLLQGPPGTGKTNRVLREMVIQLMKNPQERILLLAFTNRAVDEICRMLTAILDLPVFHRLGHGTSTSFPEALLGRKLYGKGLKEMRRTILEGRIFVSTVLTAQRKSELFTASKFSTVIVDEASQLLEPQLVGILPHFKRFILIGDEKQLPAVVTQSSEILEPDSDLLKAQGFADLKNSLFERLIEQCKKNKWDTAYGSLIDQGRMHTEIMEFPSSAFYNNRLQAITDYQRIPYPEYVEKAQFPLAEKMRNQRIFFYPSKREACRSYHIEEAEKTAELCTVLSALFPKEELAESIGIIAPYRAQLAEIKKRLPEELKNEISVDTVERFQGSQRRIIIYSLSANNVMEMPFLENLDVEEKVDRKLNVALTRAKDYCFILGAPELMQHGKVYRKLLQYLEKKHAVFTAI